MRVRSGIAKIERQLDLDAPARRGRAWANTVRQWCAAFARGAPLGDLPTAPRPVPPDEWRDALGAWATGWAWTARVLPPGEYLTGITPSSQTLADVIAANRFEWWERMRALPCYSADARPWFVPASEPSLPAPLPRTVVILADMAEALGHDYDSLAGPDWAPFFRWSARGVNPFSYVHYGAGYADSLKMPGWDLPDALPEGVTPPGTFW